MLGISLCKSVLLSGGYSHSLSLICDVWHLQQFGEFPPLRWFVKDNYWLLNYPGEGVEQLCLEIVLNSMSSLSISSLTIDCQPIA